MGVVVDIVFILFILMGFIAGWHNGFTKQIVSTIGFIVVLVLAYVMKNYLSTIFYTYLPFIHFTGKLSGVSSINILLYEILSFIIMFCLFMAIFKVIVRLTSAFEKFLNMTIILGIPSKILGGICGILEYYVLSFIIIYFLSLPTFDLRAVEESRMKQFMLDHTPVLSDVCQNTLEVYDEINNLKDEYENEEDKTKLDHEILMALKEHDFINQENIDRLVESGKIPREVVE